MSSCVTGEVKINSQSHTESESYIDPSSDCDVFNLNCCKFLTRGRWEGGGEDGRGRTKDKPPAKAHLSSPVSGACKREKGTLTDGYL